MSIGSEDQKKFAVEKYLDQVKILTALATTLLISPNLIVVLHKPGTPTLEVLEAYPVIKMLLFFTNISFLVAIIMTYFIYSSIVGSAYDGQYDVHRPATRVFSAVQLLAVVFGCVMLVMFFTKIA